MPYLTGIDLVLKENVTQKLEQMIPMVERAQRAFNRMDSSMATSGGLQKTNQQLDMMNVKLQKVAASSAELKSVGSGFNAIGGHAERATKKLSGFHSTLNEIGGAMKTMAIFGGIGAGIGLTVEGVKKGAAFNQQLGSLAFQGFSPEAIERIKKQALTQSKGNLMSPGEYVDFVKLAATGLPKDMAEKMGPIGRDVQTAFRKIGVKNSLTENVAGDFAKTAELMTYRTEAQWKMWADKMIQAEIAGGGQVPMSTIRQQLARSGATRFGTDPAQVLGQIMYHSQMQGGSKGGGGGSGSVGVQLQAVQQTLFSGRMQMSTAQAFADIGMLPGWEAAKPQIVAEMVKRHEAKHKTGSTIAKYSGGQLIETVSRGGGSAAYSPNVMLTKKEMEHYKIKVLGQEQLGQEGVAPWIEQTFIPHLAAANKMTPEQFWDLADNIKTKVKAMEMLVPVLGGTRQTMQKLMDELIIGHKQWLTFMDNMKRAPEMTSVLMNFNDQLLQTKLNAVLNAWDQFMIAFFSDPGVVRDMARLLDLAWRSINKITIALPGFVKVLDDLVAWLDKKVPKPVSDVANYMTDPRDHAKRRAVIGDAISAGSRFMHAPDSANRTANLNQVADIARAMGKDPVLAVATAIKESGGNRFSVGDYGTSFGMFQLHKGGELGSLSQMQAFDVGINARRALSNFPAAGTPGFGYRAAAAQRPKDRWAYAADVDNLRGEAQMIVNQHFHAASVIGTDAAGLKQAAKALHPHMQAMDAKNKHQQMGAASLGQGVGMPSAIGGQSP